MLRSRPLDKCDLTASDVRSIISIVGRAGAIEALAGSDVVLGAQLQKLASELSLDVEKRASKRVLANKIIRWVDRKIEKSLEELQSMSRQEISNYLTEVDCDSDEILQLLSHIDLQVKAKKSREALIEFAAVQISSLGLFQRLSENKKEIVR